MALPAFLILLGLSPQFQRPAIGIAGRFRLAHQRLLAEHHAQCIYEEMLIYKMAQHFCLSQRAQRCLDLSLDPDEPHYAPEKLFPLFLR